MSTPFETYIQDQLTLSKRLISDYRKLHLDETELVVILQLLYFMSLDKRFPTPSEMSAHTSFDEQVCSRSLRQLMQKNFLTIEEEDLEDGLVNEYYSLEPLWQALYKDKPKTKDLVTDQSIQIFKQFEQEFGRVLSPIEIETINIWLDEDKIEIALIQQALREAVLLSKLNFKYIDRILSEWQKKGIRSVDQAKTESKKFHQQQEEKPKRKTDSSIYYNWLESDE